MNHEVDNGRCRASSNYTPFPDFLFLSKVGLCLCAYDRLEDPLYLLNASSPTFRI